MQKVKILPIALPLILSNITVPLLGLVDTMVLGHLPQPYYLAGVGVATTILNMIFWSMGFLRMSLSGIASQAFGRRDYQALYSVFLRGLFIAFGIALILIILQTPIFNLSSFIIEPSEKVHIQAYTFFSIVIWSSPAVLCNFVITALFIAIQKTRAILLMTFIMNSVGIFLDLVLVLGCGMKTSGVAFATLTAYYIGMIIGLAFLCQEFSRLPRQSHTIFDIAAFKHFFSLNRDIFIRSICLVLISTYFTRAGANYGGIILATNIVLMNFFTLYAFAADGFANAAEALVGKAIGEKNCRNLQISIQVSIKYSAMIAIIASLIYWLFGSSIIHLLTNLDAVLACSARYQVYVVLLPLLSAGGFILDGIFIGATRVKSMRNAMIFSLVIFVLLRIAFYSLGNHGLWIAFLGFLLSRGVILFFIMKKTQSTWLVNLTVPS